MPQLSKMYSSRRIVTIVSLSVILVFGYIIAAYKIDPRWQKVVETIPVAWDIDRDTHWLDHDKPFNLPLLSNEEKVDYSLYYRIAWAHEAGRLLLAHPWGTEISFNTFARLVQEKFGEENTGNSHNGWLDLGLNIGLPRYDLMAYVSFVDGIYWMACLAKTSRPTRFGTATLGDIFCFPRNG